MWTASSSIYVMLKMKGKKSKEENKENRSYELKITLQQIRVKKASINEVGRVMRDLKIEAGVQ